MSAGGNAAWNVTADVAGNDQIGASASVLSPGHDSNATGQFPFFARKNKIAGNEQIAVQ